MSRLEQIHTSNDPSVFLKSMCSSYDILDLADSEEDVFQQGMQHLLKSACTSQPATHPDFHKTFLMIACAVEGKRIHLHSALDSFLQDAFQPCAIDLSGVMLYPPDTANHLYPVVFCHIVFFHCWHTTCNSEEVMLAVLQETASPPRLLRALRSLPFVVSPLCFVYRYVFVSL